ncbi:hypothetical protein HGRIS_010814 [Hohenbuehelia grisea]|uniref:Uncharacterized protein n=1 Tax=Hohenbuehelia grisea TaxID=104357 RepID=A0ABR3IXX6_9AGAR
MTSMASLFQSTTKAIQPTSEPTPILVVLERDRTGPSQPWQPVYSSQILLAIQAAQMTPKEDNRTYHCTCEVHDLRQVVGRVRRRPRHPDGFQEETKFQCYGFVLECRVEV